MPKKSKHENDLSVSNNTPGAVVIESTPFASTDDIKLGMIVRDPVTGLVGHADQRMQLLTGTTQYAIQPMGDGRSRQEAYYVDDFLLEYVGPGISLRGIPEDPKATFRLGERLIDSITGFSGVAVQRTTYLNGCVSYYLRQHKSDQSGKALLEEIPQGSNFDHKSLTKVDDGVAPKVTKAKPAKIHEKSATGGPTTRVPSSAVNRTRY